MNCSTIDISNDFPSTYEKQYVDYPETLLLSKEEKRERIQTAKVLDIPEIDYYHSNWYSSCSLLDSCRLGMIQFLNTWHKLNPSNTMVYYTIWFLIDNRVCNISKRIFT